MSHLTSKTTVVYVAVAYDSDDSYVAESADCDTLEGALECGQSMVADVIEQTGCWHCAKIETRILPIYE